MSRRSPAQGLVQSIVRIPSSSPRDSWALLTGTAVALFFAMIRALPAVFWGKSTSNSTGSFRTSFLDYLHNPIVKILWIET